MLDEKQRAAVANAGRRLSSRGGRGRRDDAHQSVLKMVQRDSMTTITVLNGIGVIATDEVVVYVEPKINLRHFRHIVSGGDPRYRHDAVEATVDVGVDWRALLARWYLDEMYRVVEYGLPQDYVRCTGRGTSIRGRIVVAQTLNSAASGRPAEIVFEADELTADNPTARVLLEGLRHARPFDRLRSDALVAALPAEIGPLRDTDFNDVPNVDPPQIVVRARALAMVLIAGEGISQTEGALPATAFFVPTPDLIEDGLRRLLRRNGYNATKREIMLPGEEGRVRLDILLDGAVGDVKYKVFDPTERWDRCDVYQAVAFAATQRLSTAFLLGFATHRRPPDVIHFGDFAVHRFLWNLAEADPSEAAQALVAALEAVVPRR